MQITKIMNNNMNFGMPWRIPKANAENSAVFLSDIEGNTTRMDNFNPVDGIGRNSRQRFASMSLAKKIDAINKIKYLDEKSPQHALFYKEDDKVDFLYAVPMTMLAQEILGAGSKDGAIRVPVSKKGDELARALCKLTDAVFWENRKLKMVEDMRSRVKKEV